MSQNQVSQYQKNIRNIVIGEDSDIEQDQKEIADSLYEIDNSVDNINSILGGE